MNEETDRYNGRGVRSRGTSDPKLDQQAVALHTATSGPPGPALRGKYRHQAAKGTRSKTSGNSGNAGRKYRCRVRQGGYNTRSYTSAGRHGKG